MEAGQNREISEVESGIKAQKTSANSRAKGEIEPCLAYVLSEGFSQKQEDASKILMRLAPKSLAAQGYGIKEENDLSGSQTPLKDSSLGKFVRIVDSPLETNLDTMNGSHMALPLGLGCTSPSPGQASNLFTFEEPFGSKIHQNLGKAYIAMSPSIETTLTQVDGCHVILFC